MQLPAASQTLVHQCLELLLRVGNRAALHNVGVLVVKLQSVPSALPAPEPDLCRLGETIVVCRRGRTKHRIEPATDPRLHPLQGRLEALRLVGLVLGKFP